jgi:hypothetical protein
MGQLSGCIERERENLAALDPASPRIRPTVATLRCFIDATEEARR